jgi:hypothetical protein
MRLVCVFLLLGLAGCADVKSHSTGTLSDGGIVHSFRCDENWDACYRAADQVCGDGGYVEIDRAPDTHTTTAGEFAEKRRADDGVSGKKLLNSIPTNQRVGTLTVRCKSR